MIAFGPEAQQAFAKAYPEAAARFAHGLEHHPLLELPALVDLASRLDPANVEYNPGKLPIGIAPEDVPTPARSIADTIRSIEESDSWMVLKFIENDPAYKVLLDETLAELRDIVRPKTGEMLTLQGFIFVSATDAVTPFHFDPEHNILLQVRGHKVFSIFPQDDETIVSPVAHEKFHRGEHHRNLAWTDDFAAKARPFALGPGDALHVPVKAPHWVKVTQGPSVSLSVTWRSDWSYEEADARAFNHMARRIGIRPASPRRLPGRNRGKSIAYRALRRLGLT